MACSRGYRETEIRLIGEMKKDVYSNSENLVVRAWAEINGPARINQPQ